MPAARKSASPTRASRVAPTPKTAAAKPLPVPVAVAAPTAVASAKQDKPHKVKVLRDTFRMPENEYAMLAVLKQRAAKGGRPARKSEVLRAGLKVLAAMGDLAFMAALGSVAPIKPARATRA